MVMHVMEDKTTNERCYHTLPQDGSFRKREAKMTKQGTSGEEPKAYRKYAGN